MSTYAPFAKPLYVMLKPVGAVCNLACDYCYYLEKSKLYVNNPKYVMSDELLEKFIEEYINSQTMPQVLFTWHGGETLMRPLAFYKKRWNCKRNTPTDGRLTTAYKPTAHCSPTNGASSSKRTIGWWAYLSTGRRSFMTNTVKTGLEDHPLSK